VLLQIGTNHLYNGMPANLPNQLGSLIDQITDRAPDALLVVAQVTPLGASFPMNGVGQYNGAIPALVQSRVAAGKHLQLVNMFAAIDDSPTPLNQLVGDNIHPNAAGYALMAEAWYEAIESVLP
jgi:lysophospholipase L1-like esterase